MKSFDLTNDHSNLYFRDEISKTTRVVPIIQELTLMGNKRLELMQMTRINFPRLNILRIIAIVFLPLTVNIVY